MYSMNEEIDVKSLKRLSTMVTDKLAEHIQSGAIQPGERLVQMDLAKRFNVSRIAVRDALMELNRRGLSVNIPHKGYIVRPISCRTVKELFDVRSLNESYAVELACGKIDAAGISLLRRILADQQICIDDGAVDDFVSKDWDFHRTIFSYCENESLMEIIVWLWAQTRQARGVAQSDIEWGKKWGENSIRRHREMLEAIEQGDAQLAARITRSIIQAASDELVGELAAVGWDAENGQNLS